MLDKLFSAFLRRADEGTLSRLLVEISHHCVWAHNGTNALRQAATTYKADTDAIALKVKQEFAAKEKSKKEPKPTSSPAVKNRKAA
jgi:ParB family chromosome partitioning protein